MRVYPLTTMDGSVVLDDDCKLSGLLVMGLRLLCLPMHQFQVGFGFESSEHQCVVKPHPRLPDAKNVNPSASPSPLVNLLLLPTSSVTLLDWTLASAARLIQGLQPQHAFLCPLLQHFPVSWLGIRPLQRCT